MNVEAKTTSPLPSVRTTAGKTVSALKPVKGFVTFSNLGNRFSSAQSKVSVSLITSFDLESPA